MSKSDKRYQILTIVRDTVAEGGAIDLPAIGKRVGCVAVTVQWHIGNLQKEGLLMKRNAFTASVVPTPTGWAWEKPVRVKAQKPKKPERTPVAYHGVVVDTHKRALDRWAAYRDAKREWKMSR